jgi:hypothetical protein
VKDLISGLLCSSKAAVVTATLLAVVGTTAVHAACAKHAIFQYDDYSLYCMLKAEVNGTCIMECTKVPA